MNRLFSVWMAVVLMCLALEWQGMEYLRRRVWPKVSAYWQSIANPVIDEDD